MRRITTFIALSIVVMICGCLPSKDELLTELYSMRIPNSSRVVYQYSYDGAFAWNGSNSHVAIFDSTEVFKISKAAEFPGEFFFTIESPTKLKVTEMSFQNPPPDSSLTPKREYVMSIKGMQLDITTYNQLGGYTVSGCGSRWYYFDTLRETVDSLIFYGVATKLGPPKDEKFAIRKGQVRAEYDLNGRLTAIRFNELVRGLHNTYHPSAPTTVVSNQPVICLGQNSFYPKDSLSSIVLSDYGVFKRVK